MHRGGIRELALVLLGFGALTVSLTYPLSFHLGTLARIDSGDGQFSIWNVAWVARALVIDPLHVFDANIFYPHRWTLAYSEANLGAGLLAIPVYWATRNPYTAHNFVLLLSFVLSALGTYYLVRYLVDDRRAGVIAAICFAYCPYVFAHLPHIQLLMTAGLPFSLLAFHRLADRPSPRRGVMLGLTMAAQALGCAYYAVFAMLLVGFAVLLIATTRRLWGNSGYWTAIAVAAGVAMVGTLPLFVPYLVLQRATGFARSLDDARIYSADWRAYFASAAKAHAWMLHLIGHWKDVLFPGFIATVFGVAGAILGWSAGGRRREVSGLYGGLAALACWASLGPDAGLYRVMYAIIPAFTFLRAPSRFGVVVALALAVLAAIAIAALPAKVSRPAIATTLLAILTTAELVVPLHFRQVPPIDPAYRVLAALPYGPVIEMPVYSYRFGFVRARYMLSSTSHWMPLVDAYSDYIPQDFLASADVLGQFPTDAAFKQLERDLVRYAVFHVDLYSAGAADELVVRLNKFAPYLRRLYADERTWLYEITGFPP